MTVAFNDAVLLREYLGPERLGAGREGLEDWARVSEGVREWFWKRKEVSGVVNVLSMALYSLFGGADGMSLLFGCAIVIPSVQGILYAHIRRQMSRDSAKKKKADR